MAADGVSISDRVSQSLENDNPKTFASPIAVASIIEAEAPTIMGNEVHIRQHL